VLRKEILPLLVRNLEKTDVIWTGLVNKIGAPFALDVVSTIDPRLTVPPRPDSINPPSALIVEPVLKVRSPLCAISTGPSPPAVVVTLRRLTVVAGPPIRKACAKILPPGATVASILLDVVMAMEPMGIATVPTAPLNTMGDAAFKTSDWLLADEPVIVPPKLMPGAPTMGAPPVVAMIVPLVNRTLEPVVITKEWALILLPIEVVFPLVIEKSPRALLIPTAPPKVTKPDAPVVCRVKL